MKLRVKFLTIAIVITFAAIMFNSLVAVGNVYQAVAKWDDSDKLSLIYRTVARPYIEVLKQFSSYNKWETRENVYTPDYLSYSSDYIIFTKQMIGDYTETTTTNRKYGYTKFEGNSQATDLFLSEDPEKVKDWVDNSTKEHVYLSEVKDRASLYGYSYKDNKYSISIDEWDKAVKKYNENVITEVGREMTFAPLLSASINKDSDGYMIPSSSIEITGGVTEFKFWREMVYTDEELRKTSNPLNAKNVGDTLYIMDVYLNPDIVEGLRKYKGDKIYVSAIPATNSRYRGGTKFYMLTPGAFLYSKVINNSNGNWSKGTLGTEGDGLGSGLNLWDNILKLPENVQKDKKIVVNHIKVKVNSAGTKTFELIETDTETLKLGNSKGAYEEVGSLYVDNSGTLTTSNSSKVDKLLLEKTKIQNNMQQYTIRAPKEETWYKVEKLTNLGAGYTYVGYAVEKDNRIDNITEEFFKNKYEAKNSEDCEFQISNANTEVIVNMYYEEGVRTVYVEHKVCSDVDNEENCIMIEGNREIDIKLPNESKSTTLYWTGSDLKEKYSVNKAYYVTAKSVSTDVYTYKRYKVTENKTGSETGTNSECTVNPGDYDVTITFYYTRKSTTERDYNKKPDIEIGGTLSILSAIGVDKNCSDGTYSVPTNAKTGENDVYVGIRDIPTYILAGINVENKEINSDVTINVKISFGPNYKTWKITVPYNLSYYVINQLLMYKYDIAEIYNTGMANTQGEVLFAENTLYAYPKNTSTLQKIENYLRTSIKTKYNIPSDNPYDKYEKDNARDITYWKENEGITLSYEALDMSINEYIKLTEEVDTKGETTISIMLLSKDIFKKVDGNSNKTIEVNDITTLQTNTNDANDAYIRSKEAYKKALENYTKAKSDYSIAAEEEEKAYNEYERLRNEYSVRIQDFNEDDYIKEIWNNCKDYTETELKNYNPNLYEFNYAIIYWKKQAEDAKEKLQRFNAASYTTEQSAYEQAEEDLKTAYNNEKTALQNFDEAYYIQENLWNVYKNYNTEQIAKLIGLDIKFEYSSGNAKLGDYELMTVNSHEFELISDTNKALNGEISGNNINTIELKASRPTLLPDQKEYYTKGIKASWISGIDNDYYENNKYLIPITRLNGKRILAGKAKYIIDKDNKIGSNQIVLDNMYYGITEDKANNTITETVFEVRNNSTFSKDYGVKEKNSEEFNIYTPLVVDSSANQDIDIIDQTDKNKYSNKDVIQSNSTFTINFSNSRDSIYTNNGNKPGDFTSRYKQVTYIKFEFAVTNVKYVGKSGYEQSFGSFEANSWIGPIYGNSITAVPYLNTTQGQSVTDQTFNYYIISAAVNTRDSWTQQLLSYINTSLDDLENANLKNILYNVCGNEGKGNLSYYADSHGELIIVNRVYDFRVTDLKDLDWKDVFRNNSSSSFVNEHSGIAYYAGLTKWNTKNPLKYNQIVGRTSDEIGSSPTRILPLGPYKNTNTSYISAPKMGYRFSFDLKVTGAINDKKYVEISPKFYYVSKDGKKFYTEGKDGIYLFYKNSQGQYVKIGSSNDKYQIQFTPNDGYRSLIETDVRNLNSSVVTLGSLTKLTLKFSETTTTSINDAAITYYGEYKLPNSTIAVKVDNNGNYDINKPLTNGYIGVVFDIKAHESNGVDLVYGKNSYKGQTNTSQWDYEGYLGLSNPGNSYSTSMKLEKGTWEIDNDTYNKIKGTVILYDTDTRASNDFN